MAIGKSEEAAIVGSTKSSPGVPLSEYDGQRYAIICELTTGLNEAYYIERKIRDWQSVLKIQEMQSAVANPFCVAGTLSGGMSQVGDTPMAHYHPLELQNQHNGRGRMLPMRTKAERSFGNSTRRLTSMAS